MAGGLILIRRIAGADAIADRGDGAACDHADGLERLARLAVARAYPLAAGDGLSDRMRDRARRLVDHPLCAWTSRWRCSCSA